ncbi:MAG: thiamine pyrophosphate-binding protein [Pseudomonadota bacterium]|nr:thiamine pyrophosphate-binding protein [Pseudomonadota bacterium]
MNDLSKPIQTMIGRSAFLTLLLDEGIDYLFGNPGTTELPIMAALHDHPDLRYVLGLQESVVVAMADGYARASNKLTACNVHVAPGLGNAMGSLFNAKWYGSPMILTAGQHEQGHSLNEPMLYAPLVPIAEPMVKWAVEVTRLQDLPLIMRRAAKVALTPPTGPVFISLPGDILNAEAALDLGERTRVDAATRPSDAALETLADRLLRAQRPLLVAGHEVSVHDALHEVAQLAETLGAGMYQQTVPYSAQCLSEHPASLGSLTRSQRQVRAALEPFDLLFLIGADMLRMSIYSPVDPMPPGMPIIQISERAWEIGKSYSTEIALNVNVKETLRALLPVLERRINAQQRERAVHNLKAIAANNWSVQRASALEQVRAAAPAKPIDPKWLMSRIVETLPRDAIVVEEALTSAASLLSFLPIRGARDYYGLASGGIGFAMAGAIGIQLAQPQRRVVAIVGDGSAMYSIQALWTAAHLKLPITYIIANNSSYRILKERVMPYQKEAKFIAMDLRDPRIDFVALAQSMGVSARRVTDPQEVDATLRECHAQAGPTLIDVVVHDGFE